MKPNDKPKQTDEVYEDPRLFIVTGKEKLPRPGLETAFVDFANTNDDDKNGSKTVGGVVCSCNKVRVVSCGCVSYRACSHCSHTSGGSRSGGGCRCAPVH